ncbi:hypothetical protein B0H17DRAFT_1267437, partial [Mycena rosella]
RHDPAVTVQTSSPPAQIALPPSAFHSVGNFPDAGDYIHKQLRLPRDAPVNLWSVSEPTDDTKPNLRMVTLMALAIYGSEAKKLTLQGIYQALITRFRWYREHQSDKNWKNSIRHGLSLYKMFVKIGRPTNEPGKGSYWVLDISDGEKFARPRKR